MVFIDSFEIPPSGAVFTYGKSRFAGNEPSQFFIRNDPVRHIACGDEHTVLVCEGGRAFAFGSNDSGQLGLGHDRPVEKPMCLKSVKPWRMQLAACGKSHTLLASDGGTVFACGANAEGQLGVGDKEARYTPVQIKIDLREGSNIVSLAAGCLHSALLTDAGEIWTWGGNADGQCGHDSSSEAVLEPTILKLAEDIPATSLSCGYYHTVFARLDGVWTMGEADNGKLGREVEGCGGSEPQKVAMDEEAVVIKVAAGGSHTLVLTEDGKVFGFGSNWCGQLGMSSEQEIHIPTEVPLPCPVNQISCGESHSAFLTEKGEVYTCGDARHGKLCREDETNKEPKMIVTLSSYWVKGIACGGCHTMILAWPQDQPDSDVVLPPLKPRPSIVHAMMGESTDGGSPQEQKIGDEEEEEPDDRVGEELEISENDDASREEIKNEFEDMNTRVSNGNCLKPEVDEKAPSAVKKFVGFFRRTPKNAKIVETRGRNSSKACTIS